MRVVTRSVEMRSNVAREEAASRRVSRRKEAPRRRRSRAAKS